MTSILKSDNLKNGIKLREVNKKFEEATSTSGCDLEMAEITSSIPNMLLNKVDVPKNVIENVHTVADVQVEGVSFVRLMDDLSLDVEDVIDGFSVFSFVTEDDIIKFSIKNEKIESLIESVNNKCKKMIKAKKQSKFNKLTKEQESYNEDGIDIYDFQANSESSPSSKHSNLNFKKLLSKKFSTKYTNKFEHKFKTENTSSPSEENSSSASVTECHNHSGLDGRNESPRPTSNDDNNVVSTTTPDNINIGLDKIDPAKASDKALSANLLSPLKTASLRIYKLEDEMSISSQSLAASMIEENPSDVANDLQLPAYYPASDIGKVYSNQNSVTFSDEKYQQKIIPTKFSVDLLTKITEQHSSQEDANKQSDSFQKIDWNKGQDQGDKASNTAIDTVVAPGESHHLSKMTSAAVKQMVGSNCCSSVAFRDDRVSSNGSCNGGRAMLSSDSQLTNDDESNNDKNIAASANSTMQSWLELHNKGIPHHQNNGLSYATSNNNSNIINMLPISAGGSSFNPLNSSSHCSQAANKSSLHDSAILDWKNNYFESSKLIPNSVPKFNQNFSALNHDLATNIRYQQDQQELMNALRLKHENSKISKPLVHMGFDSMYKVNNSLYKHPESSFQTPNVLSCIMPNSKLPTEFKTANVFKMRSDPRCPQNQLDSVSSNKDSFNKTLPAISSSNFKTQETFKKRGQWCDMHVKIAFFIYRSQKKISMIKTQEINSQLSQLIYSQKIPPTGHTPAANPYPSNFLPHSNPYLDYRSSQMKPDPSYPNFPTKTSNTFINAQVRPMNPYHPIIQQGMDADLLSTGCSYEDHQQSPEQKWLRLLSHYMTNHPLSSADRPNPEILNQLYLWYQQLAQNHNQQAPPPSVMQSSNQDANSAYLRKYMDHLSSCLVSMKGDTAGYMNNQAAERDMQLYMMKQQQYQKAMMSKYQPSSISKPANMAGMGHPLLVNSPNSFYSKKLMDIKSASTEPLMAQYPDCMQALVNQKYRLNSDQIHQPMKQVSYRSHHPRNGYSKLPDSGTAKRRKLHSESLKANVLQNIDDKDDAKMITDLTMDDVCIISESNIILENGSCPSQTAIDPDTKE